MALKIRDTETREKFVSGGSTFVLLEKCTYSWVFLEKDRDSLAGRLATQEDKLYVSPTFEAAAKPFCKWFMSVKVVRGQLNYSSQQFLACLLMESTSSYKKSIRTKYKLRLIRDETAVSISDGEYVFTEGSGTPVVDFGWQCLSTSWKLRVAIEAEVYENCARPSDMLFLRALDNTKFNDVFLRVKGGFQIPAHRVVLSAYSSVLSEAFRKDASSSSIAPGDSSSLSVVDLSEFSYETIKVVVSFLYTGHFPVFPKIALAMDVLRAADKYGIADLKSLCENHLANCVDASNVLDMMVAAFDSNSRLLKDKTVTFICLHMNRHVSLEGWEYLLTKRPDLSDYVFTSVADSLETKPNNIK